MNFSVAPARLIIIDDSAAMRELLKLLVADIPGVATLGAFETAEEGWAFIRDFAVDVILLDLELPGKNGLELLNHCRQNKAVAAIVISARIVDDPTLVEDAMRLGAIAAFPKPDGRNTTHEGLRKLIQTAIEGWRSGKNNVTADSSAVRSIIAIGASTGGVPAVQSVLNDLKSIHVPIVITQHMSATYTPRFAESIARQMNRPAHEAADDEFLANNVVYVAPGDRHLRLALQGSRIRVRLGNDSPIAGHRPSVDAMFLSLSDCQFVRRIAILLTGMGNDGAEGMLRLRQSKAITIAQNESTSVVFGMPRAAIELDAADYVLPLEKIGKTVADIVGKTQVDKCA